jgi:nucleotide-binding universal stress UspA family protein
VLARTAETLPPAEVDLRVVFGDPVEQLLAVCREAAGTLVVVGSSGGSGFSTALRAGIAAGLAGSADVPVLVVPDALACDRSRW